MEGSDLLRYTILDPAGNVTALVEAAVAVEDQPAVAAWITRRHPEVEQVGFVRYGRRGATPDAPDLELRMAGGEFCGNASLCAAALCLVGSEGESLASAERPGPVTLRLRVSGASGLVEVEMRAQAEGTWHGRIRMPAARAIGPVTLRHEGLVGEVPLVSLEGISHVVVGADSPLFALLGEPGRAERAVRAWCASLGCDGLGLMFLEGVGSHRELVPLVYVPGGDTCYWEHSCASGSAAVTMWLVETEGRPQRLTLREPGGTLRVESDPALGQTWLTNTVRIVGRYTLDAVRV